ncbi:MAG: hemerythrin domain-containing protein [Candidatus Eremiobacteraeota bacterium]|nr:hemerythrin domain-containing protein [Candidatus Eremiobacteraeota bacterium]
MSGCNDRIDIQTCRDQHVALKYLLDQMDDVGAADESRIVAFLQRLRTVLLHHLRLEDEHVYPRLRRSKNRTIQATARQFEAQMGNVAQAFTEFYSRWTTSGAISTHSNDYVRHWRTFARSLRERMSAEDDRLYAMAESELENLALDAD